MKNKFAHLKNQLQGSVQRFIKEHGIPVHSVTITDDKIIIEYWYMNQKDQMMIDSYAFKNKSNYEQVLRSNILKTHKSKIED